LAGILALASVPSGNQPAEAAGIPVSTFLQADAAEGKDQNWKVVTVELGPGAVDSRSVRPGTGLVYVLTGGGLLELDGKASIGLHPGVAVALNPEKPHVLKNTTETQTLRVLIVSFQDKARQLNKH
jgi:quercetin dioxygenase-like cupin family protein